MVMWKEYHCVKSIAQATEILGQQGDRARIVAGATDLILEIERGVRKDIETLVDITRVPGLDTIHLDEDDWIHLGPLVTHNQCVASKLIVNRAFPLAQAAWEVGAPQIRNRGTIAGNLITASPANDTIPPLIVLGGKVVLRSQSGERMVPLESFHTGVRKTVMRPDEVLVDIAFPAMKPLQHGMFIKLGLRRAQAISLVDMAFLLSLESPLGNQNGFPIVRDAVIALGAVTPTIVRAREAEEFLTGRILDPETIEQAANIAMQSARPIDDVRSSAIYRHEMVRVCTRRGLRALSRGEEKQSFPAQPVLLWGNKPSYKPYLEQSITYHLKSQPLSPIVTCINGREHRFTDGHSKTLLRLLREDGELIGTKEGCAEGECGACTVFLDGMAVMSCLVPAPRAHGAEIVTVEGLAKGGKLHPLQQAFIDEGAVQCGYCTPGFIMSGVKLLEERPNPSHTEVQQAITGNLCRCTGYYKIVRAIERAGQMEVSDG